MPEYKAPGVFVEEIESGSKPIEGVGTSTAGFVGYAKSGEFDKPFFVSNWGDFVRYFGEEENTILVGLSETTGRKATDLLDEKRRLKKTLEDYALDELKKLNGKGMSWEAFCKAYDVPDMKTPFMADGYLAYAVKGFFDNGGSRAYVVRVPRNEDLKALRHTPKAITERVHAILALPGLELKAIEGGEGGNEVTVEIAHVPDTTDGFTIKISKGDATPETFGTKPPLTPETATDILTKAKSKFVTFTTVALKERPKVTTKALNLEGGKIVHVKATEFPVVPLDKVLKDATAEKLEGEEENNSGLYALSLIDEMLMVCVPDLMAGLFPRKAPEEKIEGYSKKVEFGPQDPLSGITDGRQGEILAAQKLIIGYCEGRADSVAILDPIPELIPDDMRKITLANLSADKGHATVYYPWIKVFDQVRSKYGKKEQILIPPCGHIAGVWARTDIQRGVHKAPANEAILGIVDLERQITKGEQEILNPIGVNCIRSFPGQGMRIWGARTLATSVNQSWKYLNVRRLFDYLEKSIEKNMNWAVFEPNDHDLWGRLRRNISAFLFTEWKEGKLFGTVPAEAYYVKCDAETNPQEMIDLGRVYVEVGVNPVKPAEFVIIRIGQWSSGSSTSES